MQSQEKVCRTGEPLAKRTRVMNINHVKDLAASRVLAISLFSVLEMEPKETEHQRNTLATTVAEAVPGLDCCWGGIAASRRKGAVQVSGTPDTLEQNSYR